MITLKPYLIIWNIMNEAGKRKTKNSQPRSCVGSTLRAVIEAEVVGSYEEGEMRRFERRDTSLQQSDRVEAIRTPVYWNEAWGCSIRRTLMLSHIHTANGSITFKGFWHFPPILHSLCQWRPRPHAPLSYLMQWCLGQSCASDHSCNEFMSITGEVVFNVNTIHWSGE